MVAIRNKIYDDIVRENPERVVFECEGGTMNLSLQEFRQRIKGRSKNEFKDKFSDGSHFLLYWDWKPDKPIPNWPPAMKPVTDDKQDRMI